MWISKKKYKDLEKRIADLEVRVQSQQEILAPNVNNGKVQIRSEDFDQSLPSYKA